MSNKNGHNLSQIIIKVKPKLIFLYIFVPIVFLVMAHILGQLAIFNIIPGFRGYDLFSVFFNLDGEANIPTLYTILEWLLCVIFLVLIAFFERNTQSSRYRYWLGLAIIFGFLLIDEFISFHEISDHVLALFNIKIVLFPTNAWVLIYTAVLAPISLVYLRFMIHLPQKTKYLFVFSFIIFMLGAAGIEALELRHVEIYGQDKYYYLCFVTVEETLEMMGLLIFIYALASYLANELGVSQIKILPEKISCESTDKSA